MDRIEETRNLMRTFVKEEFGLDALKKLEYIIQTIPIEVDKNLSSTGRFLFEERKILLSPHTNFTENDLKFKSVLLHEYAHAISLCCSDGKVYHNIDEAFANLFAEMCINKELYKINKYYEAKTYPNSSALVKMFLLPMQFENCDMSVIKDYFFSIKDSFYNKCRQLLGKEEIDSLLKIFEDDVASKNQFLENMSGMFRNNVLELIIKYFEKWKNDKICEGKDYKEECNKRDNNPEARLYVIAGTFTEILNVIDDEIAKPKAK